MMKCAITAANPVAKLSMSVAICAVECDSKRKEKQ